MSNICSSKSESKGVVCEALPIQKCKHYVVPGPYVYWLSVKHIQLWGRFQAAISTLSAAFLSFTGLFTDLRSIDLLVESTHVYLSGGAHNKWWSIFSINLSPVSHPFLLWHSAINSCSEMTACQQIGPEISDKSKWNLNIHNVWEKMHSGTRRIKDFLTAEGLLCCLLPSWSVMQFMKTFQGRVPALLDWTARHLSQSNTATSFFPSSPLLLQAAVCAHTSCKNPTDCWRAFPVRDPERLCFS